MAMTFDATLKDMARESPHGVLAAFDRPPTVRRAADLVLGIGDPVRYAPRPGRVVDEAAIELVMRECGV
jgi:hypothetical protein